MRRRCLVLGILFVSVSALRAQQPNTPKPPDTSRFGDPTRIDRIFQDYLYGVVKSIDKNGVVLDKTPYGLPKSVKFDKKTKFIMNSKPAKLDQFKVGEGVFVQVKTNKKTGDMIAKKLVSGTDVTTR